MKSPLIVLSLVFALGAGVLEAQAKPITFSFTAIVASAEPVFPTVHPGDLVIGHYTFESTTPDSDPNPTRGVYFSPGTFDAKIDTLSFSFPLSDIEVLNNYAGSSSDRYTVAAISGNIQLQLYLLAETNPNALTNDNLPLLPPALSSFSTDLFLVYVGSAPNIAANVTTLVPEPATLLLVAMGFAGLAVTASTRRRDR